MLRMSALLSYSHFMFTRTTCHIYHKIKSRKTQTRLTPWRPFKVMRSSRFLNTRSPLSLLRCGISGNATHSLLWVLLHLAANGLRWEDSNQSQNPEDLEEVWFALKVIITSLQSKKESITLWSHSKKPKPWTSSKRRVSKPDHYWHQR